MRFVIYKNSILATFCSMLGAAFIAMAVMAIVSGELGILSGIGVIAGGLGIMWLGDFISTKKAERKRKKAGQTAAYAQNSGTSYTQPRQTAQSVPASSYTAQTANVYPSAAPAVQPAKKSAVLAGIFFLLTALLEGVSLYIYRSLTPNMTFNSEQIALVSMGLLLMIAAFRTKHIQQASVLFVIGFLGLGLAGVDVAMVAYRAFGFGSYVANDGSVYHAMVAAPALMAAAYFLMGILALLSTRRIKQRCGEIVRWLWFIPILPLLLVYAKEIADNDALWGFLGMLSRRNRWPGLQALTHPLLLHVYAIALMVLAVCLAGFCFRQLCKRPSVAYAQPEPQNVYTSPAQETPVQPQPEPRHTAPEPPRQPKTAPKADDSEVQKQIQAYKDLLDCGILTQEECEEKIRELTQAYYGG